MGLFGNLFDKKECAICGGEIGLMGNRKLADGNMCKNCAAKLSPFMTDRRQSTVAEIRQHLAYREQNARVLLGVTPTKVYGHGSMRIYVDENQGVFFVTSQKNYLPSNPDVMHVSQVLAVRPEIHENREELYHHDREGKRVPYNPRRYRVEYRFDVEINVNSPYFNQIRLEFSKDRPDNQYSDLYRQLESELLELQNALNPANYAAPQRPASNTTATFMQAMAATQAAADAQASPASTLSQVMAATQAVADAQAAQARKAEESEKAMQAAQLAATMMNTADAMSAPKPEPGTWTCACGSVNKGKFCPNCGQKKPVVFRCDKCGWQPEDPTRLPKFCPNCGDPFNENDVE